MQKNAKDKLVENSYTEECTENIDEVKNSDEDECVCPYTICVALTVIALAISIGIGAYFVHSRWYLKTKILFVLSLVLVLSGILFKQQFNEYNSIELTNEKSQTNVDQKSGLLFLQRNN